MEEMAHKEREQRARRMVEEAVAELPEELRVIAERIPCLLEERCLEDPEILGVYCDFVAGEMSEANGPIILYLQTIEEYCLDKGSDFGMEVRLTFLHELGHHFGWDEDDLEDRGLE